MILARIVTGTNEEDLALAFRRLGLPSSAQEYLTAKIPFAHVLLTGLSKEHGRFLRALSEHQDAPGHEEFPAFVSGDQTKRPGTALLSGRRSQFDALLREAKTDAVHAEWVRALERTLWPAPLSPLRLGAKEFALGGRPLLMGIVNVTPDSFSDGGQYFDVDAAVARGEALARAGADLLDVGGESTRPGSAVVPVEEELRRTVPVIRGLRERVPEVPVSIDTRKSVVARAGCEAGAALVNDVSGLQFDSELAKVAADAGAALCVMHSQGTPQTMQVDPRYGDAVEEILEILASAVDQAVAAGIPREQVLIDPGIGFGKTFAHNQFLLRRLSDFRALGQPVLVGYSRKAFLGALTGGKPAAERVLATAAVTAAVAMTRGADVIRVHDVAECREALTVAEAIRTATDGGALWR